MKPDLFEHARQIPAHQVARQAGISLKERGSKHWACCPFHGEKTPSLAFYPDGGWYCFGCHAGGDSIALYARLHDTTMAEAAHRMTGRGHTGVQRPRPDKAKALRSFVEAWRDKEYDRLCRIRHGAVAQLTRYTDMDAWDDPVFALAVEARGAAETEIEQLLAASPAELTRMAVKKDADK